MLCSLQQHIRSVLTGYGCRPFWFFIVIVVLTGTQTRDGVLVWSSSGAAAIKSTLCSCVVRGWWGGEARGCHDGAGHSSAGQIPAGLFFHTVQPPALVDAVHTLQENMPLKVIVMFVFHLNYGIKSLFFITRYFFSLTSIQNSKYMRKITDAVTLFSIISALRCLFLIYMDHQA